MSDETNPDDLLAAAMRPRRRARARLAEPLYRADEREIETPFGAVTAWRLGEGPAVLMVHGWEDDNALWGPLIDQFVSFGRAVVVFDLPGHGVSAAEEAWPPVCVAALRAVADALGPIEAVVGHSYGCALTVLALEAGLSVKRAVLIAPPPSWGRRFERAADAPEIGAQAVARAMAQFEARFGQPVAHFDLMRAAPQVRVKTLIVHSIDDEECSVSGAQKLADLIPGAELALADGLGHRLVAQDGDVGARIVDFVEGLG